MNPDKEQQNPQLRPSPEQSTPTITRASNKKRLVVLSAVIGGLLILGGVATAAYFSFFVPIKQAYLETNDQTRIADDINSIANAITESTTRVESVDISTNVNGFGTALNVDLLLVGAEPLSSADLTAIIVAVNNTANFSPNAIRMTALVASDKTKEVNLQIAAEDLFPDEWVPIGSKGISITRLTASRVGEDVKY